MNKGIQYVIVPNSGWRFQFFLCSPLFGEMIQFDLYFSKGLKPPTRIVFVVSDVFLVHVLVKLAFKDLKRFINGVSPVIG